MLPTQLLKALNYSLARNQIRLIRCNLGHVQRHRVANYGVTLTKNEEPCEPVKSKIWE